MKKQASLIVLMLTMSFVAISASANAAAIQTLGENVCNGAVDSGCYCKDYQSYCQPGEYCRYYALGKCVVGATWQIYPVQDALDHLVA